MSYQPQVAVFCIKCLQADSITPFVTDVENLLAAKEAVQPHLITDPTHTYFLAILKSTKEIHYFHAEGPSRGIEQK